MQRTLLKLKLSLNYPMDMRNLTIEGRYTIFKTLAIFEIIHLVLVRHVPNTSLKHWMEFKESLLEKGEIHKKKIKSTDGSRNFEKQGCANLTKCGILYYYTAFEIQVVRASAIKWEGIFWLFQFASAIHRQKGCRKRSRNLCILRRRWLRDTSAFCQRLFVFLTVKTTCST